MDGKKRKVMFLIYSLCGGGAERVLVETVNRLPKDRYDVTLMTLFHDDTRAGMLSPEVHYRPRCPVASALPGSLSMTWLATCARPTTACGA